MGPSLVSVLDAVPKGGEERCHRQGGEDVRKRRFLTCQSDENPLCHSDEAEIEEGECESQRTINQCSSDDNVDGIQPVFENSDRDRQADAYNYDDGGGSNDPIPWAGVTDLIANKNYQAQE